MGAVKTIVVVGAFLALAYAPALAEGDRLGRDDFVSSTISDVFEKVGKYTSGEKRLFDRDEQPAGRVADAYNTDPLGRPIPDTAIKPLKRPAESE